MQKRPAIVVALSGGLVLWPTTAFANPVVLDGRRVVSEVLVIAAAGLLVLALAAAALIWIAVIATRRRAADMVAEDTEDGDAGPPW